MAIIRNICLLKAKFIVLKKQVLELLRAPRRILLHRRLRSSSNLADQVRRFLLLRKEESKLAGQTIKKKMLLRLWAQKFWPPWEQRGLKRVRQYRQENERQIRYKDNNTQVPQENEVPCRSIPAGQRLEAQTICRKSKEIRSLRWNWRGSGLPRLVYQSVSTSNFCHPVRPR